MDNKNFIAKRAAAYFKAGDIVNLGVGIPSLCSNYAVDGVMFQSENGMLGSGEEAEGLLKVESYCNASGEEVVPVSGASSFDSAYSFGMIRGGRINATVLGALQVSECGDIANWDLPGRMFGMGGAMDLVNGTKSVIVAMELTTKDGKPKVVKKCIYPLTGVKCVNHIVTECCVLDVTKDGLVITEVAPGYEPEDIQKLVEPKLIIADGIKIMNE